MGKFVVTGGNKLEGKIRVCSAKNAVLPILAATLISGKKSVITDYPIISDVINTLDILEDIGCDVCYDDNKIIIDSKNAFKTSVDESLTEKMRSSFIFAGGLIARFKKARTCFPGGCELGGRPVDLHIKAFREMGADVEEQYGFINFDGSEMKACDVHLSFPSVGATENIMLAATTLPGTTRIINAAKEPEIIDLAEFLNKMGGKIKNAGSTVIEIEGVSEFKDVEHTVIPDRIVASTYIAAATITGSEIILENVEMNHLDAVVSVFKETGTEIESMGPDVIKVKGPEKIRPIDKIRTSPYPGFPTDVQSLLTAVLTVADGTSIVMEDIFNGRFKLVEELVKMGADITVNGNCAIIKGKEKLYGAKTQSPDLRSGAALVVSALRAEGESEISNSCFIERGYEDLAGEFCSLGADIRFV